MRSFVCMLGVLAVLMLSSCFQNPTGNVVIEDIDVAPGEPIESAVNESVDVLLNDTTEIIDGAINESSEELNDTSVSELEINESEEPKELKETIIMKDLKYSRTSITVKVGTEVTWVHEDQYKGNEVIHFLVIRPIAVSSGRMMFGDEFSYTFTEPGEYFFLDSIYNDVMSGTIVVEE